MDFLKFPISFLIYQIHWWLPVENSEILSLFSNQEGDYCLTNSSLAMYYTTISDVMSEGTMVIPNIDYFCDFERGKKPNRCISDFTHIIGGWTIVNSFSQDNLPVFDRRWEDLPIRKLYRVKKRGKKKLSFETMLTLNNQEEFRVMISLRSTESHFLFCDKEDVTEGSCYWFILQGWRSTKTAVRKCENQIPIEDRKYPSEPCYSAKEEIKHPQQYPQYLSMEKWSHLTFEKNGRNFFLKHTINGRTETILKYTDNGELFNLQYMMGHTKEQVAYYKLQDYDYLRTTSSDTTALFPNEFSVLNHEVCFSIFLTTCLECWISVKFLNPVANPSKPGGTEWNTIQESTLDSSYGYWTPNKIIVSNISREITKVYVALQPKIITGVSNPDGSQFWAIDNFRTCHAEEYRISNKHNHGDIRTCELVTKDLKVSLQEDTKFIPRSSCGSLKRLGESCISCDILEQGGIGLACKKLKICENDNGHDRCYCSPGYTGVNCEKECQAGTYGYGCENDCGNCYNEAACDVEDGSCAICHFLFDKPTCHIPTNDLIIKKPPTVLESQPDSCTVQLTSIDYIGKTEPKYYLVQYQKVAIGSNPINGLWIDGSTVKKIEETEPTVISGLKSSNEYVVRILISDLNHRIRNMNLFNKIPYAVCNTTCKYWIDEDIAISPGATNAQITVKLDDEKCKITSYNYEVLDENNVLVASGNPSPAFTVVGLSIFSEYKIIFKGPNDLSQNFKTKEGVPSVVRNVTVFEQTTTSVSLKWTIPEFPNGLIEKYKVEYKRERGKFCKEATSSKMLEESSTEPLIELRDLIPFSTYSVNIYAINSKYPGEGITQEIETAALGSFAPDEGLDGVAFKVSQTHEKSIVFLAGNLQCQKLQGPIDINVKYQCISEWCRKLNRSTEVYYVMNKTDGQYVIKDLEPFTEYITIMSFCRAKECIIAANGTVRTLATVPNRISDLWASSKGADYITLRWFPPFPPTGTLLAYTIINTCETCHYERKATNNFNVQKCKIWPNYHCVKLTEKIYNKYTHNIWIQAANAETGNYVDVYQKFRVRVEETQSDPPYNLRVEWHNNNTMELFWNHPNRTNGYLKEFDISISYKDKIIYMKYPVDENKYRLTYNSQVKEYNIPLATDLRIEVIAINAFKSFPTRKTESSPPPFPILTYPNISVINYSKSSMTISLDATRKILTGVSSYLFIFITEPFTKIKDDNVELLAKTLNITIEQEFIMRIAAEVNLNDLKSNILNYTIGDDSSSTKSSFLNREIVNKPLEEGQYSNITVFLVNVYKTKYRYKSYPVIYSRPEPPQTTPNPLPGGGTSKNEKTPEENSSGPSALLLLLLILLLVPILIGILIYRKNVVLVRPTISLEKMLDVTKRTFSASSSNESLPLEAKEPYEIIGKSVIKVKPKLARRKSMNPPNPPEKIHSKPIKIADFEDYVRTSIENGQLKEQHAFFPRGQTQPWQYGLLTVNKPKNRHNNLVAYDHTRVELEKLPGDEHSDYINANYIDGYNVARAYIATQGPKPATLEDFWRMIWQENVKNIVMLANIYEGGKKKVEQYWPNINEELNFGDICVQYQSMELFADFEYRIFYATRENEKRKIEQLHFTTWPDHGVPLYPQSFVPFLRKILKIPLSSSSPVVVHCSVGVGRTGTILLCDICLRMAAKEGVVDMLNNLQKLREQRPNMVDNVEQYKLAHLVLLECLMGLRTSIPCNDDMDKVVAKLIKEGEYRIQINYLKETEWQDQAMKSVAEYSEESVNFPEKNRFEEIVPENQEKIFLARYPNGDVSSSYINAVQVDGFRCPGRFIVTQQPLPNTLGDFWRLIVERQTNVIVNLNEINHKDKTCCQFLPTKEEPNLQPVDFILLTLANVVTLEYYDIYSINIWVKKTEKQKMNVEIISFKKWPARSHLPASCEEFLSFWEESDAILRRSRNVVVTCYDGANASGVYVALSFVIEKMKLEQECDVCLAIRTVRRNRKHFVTKESQFIFLYEAAAKYINGFQSYANFQNQ